jgi:hypothetical protein
VKQGSYQLEMLQLLFREASSLGVLAHQELPNLWSYAQHQMPTVD